MFIYSISKKIKICRKLILSFSRVICLGSFKSLFTSSIMESHVQLQPENVKNLLVIDKTPYTVVSEGKAEVLFPSSHDVFYNPVQEFNRDISIAILKQYVKEIPSAENPKQHRANIKNNLEEPEIHVLEALAASGLRSIRFAKEVLGLKRIVANDISAQAYASIERNIKHNNVEDIVKPNNEDASFFMYKNRNHKKRFNVIDLDPYGTAAPFLDAAVQSLTDGGLLMVTCTDMAVLCGNGIEACHAKYGAVSAKTGACHEMALRIVLQCIESHANRYGRYIVPLLSLSVDFYVRVFVQIYTSPVTVKDSICKLSMVYICSTCGTFSFQPLGSKLKTEKGVKFSNGAGPPVGQKCNICNGSHKICGPVWSANLHNKEFVQKAIEQTEQEKDSYQTSKRILGMLNIVFEELDDSPLYYRIEKLSSSVHVVSPTNIEFKSAILNAGYKVSMSHVLPTSIKTDAPNGVIWDIIRAWARLHPGKKTFENEPSKTIMSKESITDVSFHLHPDADPQSRTSGLLRFQVNPERYWGPKCRAKSSLFNDQQVEKQLKCQNKRRKNEKQENIENDLQKKLKSEELNENASTPSSPSKLITDPS